MKLLTEIAREHVEQAKKVALTVEGIQDDPLIAISESELKTLFLSAISHGLECGLKENTEDESQ